MSHRALSSLNISPYRAMWTHFRQIFMIFIDLILEKLLASGACPRYIHQAFTIDSRWNWDRYTINKLANMGENLDIFRNLTYEYG